MRKAVVTGANGFVGTALCRTLSSQGVEVIAVVKNEEENIAALKQMDRLRIVYCDLSNFANLAAIIGENVDAVYHLAWVGSAGMLRGNDAVQLNNVRFTCDTVKAAAEMECKRFIFASSIMEYEIGAIMASDARPEINTLYSSAKVAADYMARTLAGKLGISYIRAVISNIYGPGETSPRLINTSIRKMLNGERCSFSLGNQMYDFIYIDDAARIFSELGKKGVANRTYYIGSPNPRPLKEFLCTMRDQIDPSIELGLGDLEFNGVSLTYEEFDIAAVFKDTGYEPKVGFPEGIQRTIKWIKEEQDGRV